mmetsp:Transcript_42774/g.115361  ORF Transcript_42774/g.115361 Transcript_42774/m.115361 type:complete len:224 (+) Transcript_42774:129-800(+)
MPSAWQDLPRRSEDSTPLLPRERLPHAQEPQRTASVVDVVEAQLDRALVRHCQAKASQRLEVMLHAPELALRELGRVEPREVLERQLFPSNLLKDSHGVPVLTAAAKLTVDCNEPLVDVLLAHDLPVAAAPPEGLLHGSTQGRRGSAIAEQHLVVYVCGENGGRRVAAKGLLGGIPKQGDCLGAHLGCHLFAPLATLCGVPCLAEVGAHGTLHQELAHGREAL